MNNALFLAFVTAVLLILFVGLPVYFKVKKELEDPFKNLDTDKKNTQVLSKELISIVASTYPKEYRKNKGKVDKAMFKIAMAAKSGSLAQYKTEQQMKSFLA